jgi:beta-phosphoglucomutase
LKKDNLPGEPMHFHAMFHTVILDFDGVVLESVSVKTEAFRSLFSSEPDHVDEIVDFHIKNGGMSRFDKFRYIYKHFLHRELDNPTFNRLSEEFAGLVYNGVVRAPFVPGAETFLENFSKKIPLYIVSATPEEELVKIIRERKLSAYSQQVFGAPWKKADCIRNILITTGFPPDQALFVGDALNDLAAARAAGVKFVGRVKPGDENIFCECMEIETTVSDLHDLAAYLEEKL